LVMSFVRNIVAGLRSLFRKEQVDRELDEELRSYMEMAVDEKMKQGMMRKEAVRTARLERGSLEVTKEIVRAAGWESFVETCWQDLRFGLRTLSKSPAFTCVAVLTLGLGIGTTTAIFCIVNAVLLKPLAMRDPAHVVYLQEQWHGLFPDLSVGNFADVRGQNTSFANLCASHNGSFNLATESAPERVEGEYVTADYFETFGVQPIAGRVFSAEEDQPGHAQVVVLSERLWHTHFRTNRAIVGSAIRVNGLPYTVAGVMPNSFDPLLSKTDLWTPAAFSSQQLANHDDHFLNVIGRLKPGVSLPLAQSELNVIAMRLQQQYPSDDKGRGLHLLPLSTALLGDQRLALGMLFAAVGFLLLIACANIANLQLARSRMRQREIAVRAALGATSKRIVRQLLTENIVLGLVGAVFGVLLAYAGVKEIVAFGPADVPRLDEAYIDLTTLSFACGVSFLASALFGIAPALRSASTQLTEAFKAGIGTSSGSRDRIRSLLVVGEIALALFLMAGAGLLIRSGLLVSHLDPGFDTANLTVGRISLPDPGFHDPTVARQTFERIVAAADTLPGVLAAAVVSRAPLAGGGSSNGIIAEGKAIDPSNAVNAEIQIVSPDYLPTVRIPLKTGRDFTSQDTRDVSLVTIVNETLARTLWPGENPIGKRFACCESGPKGGEDPAWHEVVGVVADVRAWGLDQQVRPEFYVPIAQMPPSSWDWIGRTMDLTVRTQAGAISAEALQSTVGSVASEVPIYQLSTMQQKIAGTLERSHFDTFLLTLFAATALLLSSVGIYGVMSYVVAQRTRDIGIRMALGATRGQILRDVLAQGIRLTAAGLVVGLAGALMGTQLLASLLYGVQSSDAITFAVASSALCAVALLASYVPARRATRVDPIVALHYE
jgi:putative ABC transport system permease protein